MTQYDPVAAEYEARVVPKFRPIAERLLAAADIRPADDVLEVAGGTGGLARLALAKLGSGGSLTLTDLSPEMLRIGQGVLDRTPAGPHGRPALTVARADLEALPVADASVDRVVAQMTPLFQTDRGVAEAHRVLRPGGLIAAAFWGPRYSENDFLNGVRQAVGIPAYPLVRPALAGVQARRAGFEAVTHRTRILTVRHASAEAYLRYRDAFGTPPTIDADVVARFTRELERRLAIAAPDGSPIRFTWSVTILTGRKPAAPSD